MRTLYFCVYYMYVSWPQSKTALYIILAKQDELQGCALSSPPTKEDSMTSLVLLSHAKRQLACLLLALCAITLILTCHIHASAGSGNSRTTTMLSSILGKRKYTSLASSDVAILPTIKTSAVSADPSGYARLFSRRHLRTLGFASLSLFALGLYYSSGSMKKVDVSSATPSLPPLYEAYIEKERQLPQHQSVTPAEPGSGKKYLWFANHVRGESMQFTHL